MAGKITSPDCCLFALCRNNPPGSAMMIINNHRAAVLIVHLAAILVRDSSGFSPAPSARTRIGLQTLSSNGAARLSGTNLRANKADVANIIDVDEEPCLVGDNVVGSCDISAQQIVAQQPQPVGTQTKLSAATNLGKCICGAGSFALPHVFLKEGVLGGTLAMMVCGYLAMTTMQSINNSRFLAVERSNDEYDGRAPPTSYVELAEISLGGNASKVVFALTLAASLGVCSTYIVFVGQTLASLSTDALSDNVVHNVAPNIDERTWEVITAATVFPLSLIRNYGVFKFTSALGVTAVLGGILVTLTYGVLVDPGGGIYEAISAVSELKTWPDSFQDAFGGSFGTIAYLFCVNFLTFPIINMQTSRSRYMQSIKRR